MFCCDELINAMNREIIVKTEPFHIRDGRIANEVNTEYFLRGGETSGRYTYLGFNYCPFCGRALSRGLWAQEKKK